jgi:hypothetical protein
MQGWGIQRGEAHARFASQTAADEQVAIGRVGAVRNPACDLRVENFDAIHLDRQRASAVAALVGVYWCACCSRNALVRIKKKNL